MNLRKHESVDERAVLEIARALPPLEIEPGLREHPCRGSIVSVDRRMDADKIEVGETPFAEAEHRFAHDATAPKSFSEPIAKFSDVSGDTGARGVRQFQADTTDHFISDRDGKVSLRLARARLGDPFDRVVNCIRMRNEAHVPGDTIRTNVLG